MSFIEIRKVAKEIVIVVFQRVSQDPVKPLLHHPFFKFLSCFADRDMLKAKFVECFDSSHTTAMVGVHQGNVGSAMQHFLAKTRAHSGTPQSPIITVVN